MGWNWMGAGLGALGMASGIPGLGEAGFGMGGSGARAPKSWEKGFRRALDPGGIFSDPQSASMPERDPGALAQQRNALNMTRKAAMGEGPSAAADQMRLGAGYGAAQAQGMAAGQTGMSPAQAARMAQMGGMEQRARANEQAGILRAKEQQAAQQMYADMVNQQNMQDLQRMQIEAQMASENAKLGQIHQGGVLSAVGGLIGGLI